MIQIVDKRKCMGCSACAQICPQKCIMMEEDNEGFLYPKVDRSKCVKCNLCNSICPVSNHPDYSDTVLSAYAGYSKDEEIRLQSSSGGMFSMFASTILKENGVVFGATLDDNLICRHTAIENIRDLYRLQGSKYVQSIIGNSYLKIRDYLRDGRKVLFTGTACQCAGLKAFLKEEYDNLLIIDILCHGVPSPKVFEKYLQGMELERQEKVQDIYFRSKTYGWKNYAVKLVFGDNSKYEREGKDDEYIKLFLSEICLRPSCYECQFKKLERPSDITLGDAWGIQRTMPELDDNQGTSAIIIHTKKGMKNFEDIKKNLVFKEMDVNTLVSPQADSRKSVKPHPNRKKFFKRLNESASWHDLYTVKDMTLCDRIRYKLCRIFYNKRYK